MTFPIRVFFESSVKEDVESALANPDAALAAYIEANAAGDGVRSMRTSGMVGKTATSWRRSLRRSPTAITT